MIAPQAHAECVRVLNVLISKKMQESWSWVFMHPVAGIPGYEDVVKKPMDLGTVKKNLGLKPTRCRFKTHERFAKDVRLVFQNALLYNKDDASIKGSVYDAARYLLELFEKEYQIATENVFSKVPGTVEDSDKPKPLSVTPVPSRSPSPQASLAPSGDEEQKNCLKIVKSLMSDPLASPFLDPVDCTQFIDYKIKVKRPMHLKEIEKKLKNKQYSTLDAFAADVRLVFSNCLVYNSDAILSKAMRTTAIHLMKKFEQMLEKIGGIWPGIKQRFKCHDIIEKVLLDRTDDVETAQWFKYPIQAYFETIDMVPPGYFDYVKKPMDIGTVSEKLHTAKYTNVSEFEADLSLVFENCLTYWQEDVNGKAYCDSSRKLLAILKREMAQHFNTTVSSSKKSLVKKKASSVAAKLRGIAEKDECLEIVKKLKAHEMTIGEGVRIRTAGPFLRPVDVSIYKDYREIVKEPIDLSKIERKLKTDRYTSLEEFSADVHLIFTNCRTYNSDPVHGADIRAMAKTLEAYFEELLQELAPDALKKDKKKKKKKKKKDKRSASISSVGTGGITPLNVTPLSTKKTLAGDSKKRKLETEVVMERKKSRKSMDELAPLDLPEPEASYDKVLRRLLRHPFVETYHFNRPVYEAIPSIRESYFQVIARPLDLIKVREMVLNRGYSTPEKFIQDVRLVFENAITFNCTEDDFAVHVRQVAEHLLNTFMHLCTEMLENYGIPERKTAFRKKRQELIQSLPLRPKSRECCKILRSLNSQKYDKLCWPFRDSVHVLFPDIPPDYFDVVTCPMDLKQISEKINGLSDESFRNYGEFVADMRLTFENSILYNKADALKEGWTVYRAATEMLGVFDEMWAEATLDIAERAGRDEVLRLQAARDMAKKRAEEIEEEKMNEEERVKEYQKKLEEQRVNEALAEKQKEQRDELMRKLNIEVKSENKIARAKYERMTKEERKAEERRRKRERREEEIAKSEQRRQTAVAATDDALREAEMRSRRRIYKRKQIERIEQETQQRREQQLLQEKQLITKEFDRQVWLKSSKITWKSIRRPVMTPLKVFSP